MKILKKIKKYGNAFIVNFTKEEMELHKLKQGDMVIVTLDEERTTLNPMPNVNINEIMGNLLGNDKKDSQEGLE